MLRRRITILGSTGSIGTQTLAVLRQHPAAYQVVGLCAGTNAALLRAQVREFRPEYVALFAPRDERTLADLRQQCEESGTQLLLGEQAALSLVEAGQPDLVVSAIVGEAGLLPTLRALERGVSVALANKEALVVAGQLLTAAAKKYGAALIPIDSEHYALQQCLLGRRPGQVRRLTITASGGPFRTREISTFPQITPAEAVAHPVWSMGRKISVDSATLMNKGLEVIEAVWLFGEALGLDYDHIGVLVHPQSIVHGLVEFSDGSVLSHLAAADMRLPIAAALAWPEPPSTLQCPLDLERIGRLEFYPVEAERYPALAVALAAGRRGGTAPAVLNAANEVAVDLFLRGELPFTGIVPLIEAVLGESTIADAPDLTTLLAACRAARQLALDLSPRLSSSEIP